MLNRRVFSWIKTGCYSEIIIKTKLQKLLASLLLCAVLFLIFTNNAQANNINNQCASAVDTILSASDLREKVIKVEPKSEAEPKSGHSFCVNLFIEEGVNAEKEEEVLLEVHYKTENGQLEVEDKTNNGQLENLPPIITYSELQLYRIKAKTVYWFVNESNQVTEITVRAIPDHCITSKLSDKGVITMSVLTSGELRRTCGLGAATGTLWNVMANNLSIFFITAPMIVMGILATIIILYQSNITNSRVTIISRIPFLQHLSFALRILEVKHAHILFLWVLTPLIIIPYMINLDKPSDGIWTIFVCFSFVWLVWLLEYINLDKVSLGRLFSLLGRSFWLFVVSATVIPLFIWTLRALPIFNEIAYLSDNANYDRAIFLFQAGLFEEVFKILPLVIYYELINKMKLPSLKEIMVYAMAIGLGFAAAESVVIIAGSSFLGLFSVELWNIFFVLRLLTNPILHVALTSIIAYHLFYIDSYKHKFVGRWKRGIVVILGVGVIHGLYNIAALTYWNVLIMACIVIAYFFHATYIPD